MFKSPSSIALHMPSRHTCLTTHMLALLTGLRHSSLQGGEAAGGVQYRLLVRACTGDKAPLGDQVRL